MSGIRRVLVINPILYHYRRGVFLALESNGSVEVTFASDAGGVDGIPAMSAAEVKRHVLMRVHRGRMVEWQAGIVSHLFGNRYDDVIFLGNAKYVSTWAAALLARVKGMRVYFWTIGWHRPESGFKRWVRLRFYRLAHGLLLYGETGRVIGASMGYPERRMHVIGNSVESAPNAIDRNDLKLPSRDSATVYLGAVIRLTPVKRLDLLISAAALLQERGRAVHVLLVGDGPEASSLRRQADALGVNLDLPGAVYSPHDLDAVYRVLDITVVPEAVGLTAIQSLGHGIPVISADSPYAQMPEWESIVPGVTGEVYRQGDLEDLVDSVLRLYSRIQRERSLVAENCRAEVRNRWSSSEQAQKIVKALHEGA